MKRLDDILVIPVIFAIVVAMIAFCSRAHSQEYREQYRAICQISMENGQGSGTLIQARPDLDLGLVLSCRHVCEKPGKQLTFEWLWADSQVTYGETVAVVRGNTWDTDMAIAVCKLPHGVKPLKVVPMNPANFPLVAAGFRDDEMRVSRPNSNAKKLQDSSIYLPFGLIKGMSGGPLLDYDGNIVGVVVASNESSWARCSDGPRLQALVRTFRKIPAPDPSK